MNIADGKKTDAILRRIAAGAVDAKPHRRFRVVLEGVKGAYETEESFAIKFGLAASQPVTAVKRLLRSVPSMVWEGEDGNRAAGILAMIDEAGGRGRIDEIASGSAPSGRSLTGSGETDSEGPPDAKSAAKKETPQAASCPKCGFPARTGDEYCPFCMSPYEERLKHRVAEIAGLRPGGRYASIPPRRLLLYVSVLLAALLIDILLR